MHQAPSLLTQPGPRVLVISDAPSIQQDLTYLANDALGPDRAGGGALDLTFATTGEQGVAMVEAAVREGRPFAAVMTDWRVFNGRDCTLAVQRLWQLQNDIHVVLHAVFDHESRTHIGARLGVSHRLLVLKHELAPFEIARLAKSLEVKWQEERELAMLRTQVRDAARPLPAPAAPVALPPAPALAPAPQQRALEESLRQVHRLETMGRLTDGIAHEFNNSLTVMQGHLSVALAGTDNNGKLVACVEEVMKEAKRAAEMTRQLLSFSHREYLEPRPIRLDLAVEEEVSLLRRTLGEQITIEVDHETDLPPVMADPATLGQILVNLAVRARDAMPKGGKLAIHTRRMHVPNQMAAGLLHPEAKAGDYVVMALVDGGKGMSAEELGRVFDIALATREKGGSGMGLVLVQELVRHQGGWISASSVPEVGTEFSVHLPAAPLDAVVQPLLQALPPPVETRSSNPESSTILIVDDEDSVRQVMEFVLISQGHTVVAAKDANEGWSMWCKHSRTINLAIVDIKLPGGISGFDLERAIGEADCTVPVVFTCGYCPTSAETKKELKVGVNYLPKPFGMAELLSIVNQAIRQPVKF